MGAAIKNFYLPTPKKYRQLGDAILGFTIMLQPSTLTLPLTVNGHVWLNFGILVVGYAAKQFTNFWTDQEPPLTPNEMDIVAANMPEETK